MLHKVFEGCGHLWTWIHNCGCAASLSIGPTVSQTSEDGGDAEWYLATVQWELCNYDFISSRWWAECIYELKNAFGWLILHLPQNKNACWEMSSGMNWNEHAGDDELDGLPLGFWCFDNLPQQSVRSGLVLSQMSESLLSQRTNHLELHHENESTKKESIKWYKQCLAAVAGFRGLGPPGLEFMFGLYIIVE